MKHFSENAILKLSCIVLAVALVLSNALMLGFCFTIKNHQVEASGETNVTSVPVLLHNVSHSVSHSTGSSSVMPIGLGTSESYGWSENWMDLLPAEISYSGYFKGEDIVGIFEGDTSNGHLEVKYQTGTSVGRIVKEDDTYTIEELPNYVDEVPYEEDIVEYVSPVKEAKTYVAETVVLDENGVHAPSGYIVEDNTSEEEPSPVNMTDITLDEEGPVAPSGYSIDFEDNSEEDVGSEGTLIP